ncbi:adhesion G protein-coupled receptor L3-like isoform X2 [Dermacentor albipictus]|uniref:adhesion G protein-coupled receptor L3-like isoform X2 n=1 Tax=Dermacentor albipictus TaxID=60249 RepID=UPI0038FD0BDE
MCALGEPGGSVRQLSLCLPVRIGRRGSVLALAVTLCAVVLLCALEPAAASAVPRTHVRRQVFDEREVFLLTTNSPYTPIESSLSNPQPKRVRCYYFKTRPVRTYCHVLGLTGVVTAQAAQNECRAISMDIISMNTTPMHRLCTLMKLFGLEERKLWLADVLNQSGPLTWDECNIEVLAANVTKAPSNCTICNIAVVCDAGFYHESGSNCVVVEQGNDDMEYCYYDEKATVEESRKSCLSQSPQSMLMNVRLLNEPQLDYVRRVMRTDLEFWVDLKEEDVRELSGVVAFNADSIDWGSSCFTVWFGRDVPWFFKRNCDELYPVVCEDSTKTWSLRKGGSANDCIYHRSQSWMFDYCVPEGRTFNMAAGSRFCSNHSMHLLKGRTLHELFFVYTRIDNQPRDALDKFLIWEAGSVFIGRTTCRPVSFLASPITRPVRSCQEKLGYICRRSKPPETHRFNCENVSRIQTTRPPTCENHSKLPYEESVKACSAVGMNLLPEGLDINTYENLLMAYGNSRLHSEAAVYWLSSAKSDSNHCMALVHNYTDFILDGINCSTKLRSLCVFANIITLPPIVETTSIAEATATSPATSKPISSRSPVPGPRTDCPSIDDWPSTERGSTARKPCCADCLRDITRKCEENGQWSEYVNKTSCVSKEVEGAATKLNNSANITEVTQIFQELNGKVTNPGDIKAISSCFETVLESFDSYLVNLSESERVTETRQLATTVVDLASHAMQNKHVWGNISKEERLDTAASLINRVEDIVIKMIGFNAPLLDETTIGSGNITIKVKPVTDHVLEAGTNLSAPTGATVQLFPGFLTTGTKNANIIFSENTLVKNMFGSTSANGSADSPILATSFVTASVVMDGKRTSRINGNVMLSFMLESIGKDLTPKCSFIEPDAGGRSKWSTGGCEVAAITNEKIVCSCNHLTVFAVLMNPADNFSCTDIDALKWITKIGCGISIVCLVTCIIVFTVYRQLKGIRNTIHRNLCLSLLFAEILLLAGMERSMEKQPPDVSCAIVAFFLHFLFLSVFGWMALEGCHIIVLLWKVFNQKRTYYERYYFAGYGIPLLIAGITLGCRYELYVKRNPTDQFCWLPEEKGVRYSFIGPVAAVVLLNLGALVLVLWKMSHVRCVVERTTAEKVQNWVRGTFIMLPILGMTWLFGFLMLGDNKLHTVGAYLFTIFNSLQGLGIFICHVVLSKKTREAIFRSLVSTGSLVKGSMSSRPSGSGSSSTKTTWYPISLSSNSTSHSSSSSKDFPSNDAEQPSQSFNTEATSWTPLQWLPGTRFRYNLRLNEPGARPLRSRVRFDGGDQRGQPALAKFRLARSIVV